MVEIFSPLKDSRQQPLVSEMQYQQMYARSLDDPESFWAEQARRIDWYTTPQKIKNTDFKGEVLIKWYEDGVLNACYNCVDRHLPAKENHTALIWESDDPSVDKKLTYWELKNEVCRCANALKAMGVGKGDRVVIYMPMVPEAVIAMLACARIGAVHSVVFGGFSPESLRNRILDCGARVVITADEGVRGGRKIPLKDNTDEALTLCPDVGHVLVLKRTGGKTSWIEGRDQWWHEQVNRQSSECPCEKMSAIDPLFILYTSGSTGKPKGILHTTGGYMVYVAFTHQTIFDYRPNEVYWCTADVGWITGHSYLVYGPLANGATSLVFEGVPHYPDWSRFWQVVDKHNVAIFYTAPTAIRSILRAGDAPVKKTSRQSLRILGSVGEPINHEAWRWFYDTVGEKRCPIVDTWWQTETGGILISPLSCHALKPSAASKPFFGVLPVIVDAQGHELQGECEGDLCIADSWPGQMSTIWGDHERFIKTYFFQYKGKYFTGDRARRDQDGDLWITGRADDVIKVSGHRLGTAEIESAINEHGLVAESAVVGYPHDIKGQGIYAFVTLLEGRDADENLKQEIVQIVRKVIGPVATPDIIQFTPALPKTRSGKIMRRILRKIAAHEFNSLGDISTLVEPDMLAHLIAGNKAIFSAL